MKCLNTKGCYNRKAKKESNFCSNECRLTYENKLAPSKRKREVYNDPERQQLHDIFIKYYGKQNTLINKRGVKKGEFRGPYRKNKIKKRTFTCKGCGGTYSVKSKRMKQFHSEACRRRYWRKKKKQKELEEHLQRKY